MARTPLPLALLALGCATAPGAHAPDLAQARALDVAYTRALAKDSCQPDDAVCCQTLAQGMHRARARHDDRAADEAAELLALTCPARREAILEPGRGGPFYRRDLENAPCTASVQYQLRLAREDRLVWAAAYLDGARLGPQVPAGKHTLLIVLDVVSGLAPTAGQTIHLTRTADITLHPGAGLSMVARVGRTEGQLRLDVELPAGAEGDGVRAEGTIGLGNLDLQTPELRHRWPAFEPPAELQPAGAPPAALVICPGADGQVRAVSFPGKDGAPHAHPRQLAAALEWTRQLTFESTDPTRQSRLCPQALIGFDARHVPPVNTEVGVGSVLD